MIFTTGQRIIERVWTVLITPKDVVNRLHSLARESRALNSLTFEICNHLPILNNDAIHAITIVADKYDDGLTYQSSDSNNSDNIHDSDSSDDSD